MKFTRKQVENKLICYAYDDSEELLDNFTIFANSSELGKQSFPQTLFVTVESVNDEAPIITANKILQVLLLWPQVMKHPELHSGSNQEGQLVFVHSGAMSGGFNFQVTDGLNFAPGQIFSITAGALIISLEVNRGLSIFPGMEEKRKSVKGSFKEELMDWGT
ncbi:Chondroitin sulfate proteoglycan 4 [Manis javanica]|nr:Chondroitin sulfate proteoglycan 4 [Manis javanica]